METLLIYYSHTGNNAVLAEKIASETGMDTFRLREKVPRTTGTIIRDMIFQLQPPLEALPENVEAYDLVLFMGPLWMFHIPAPLRTCFRRLKGKIRRYAFVSLSGGALGPNTSIGRELVRRLGKNQAFHLDLNISQFCQVKSSPRVEDTAGYQLADHPEDAEKMTRAVVGILKALKE